MKGIRSSFSQHNIFNGCPRQWYLQYIKKIPAIQDMCYAHAGSVIHKCLEMYYEGKIKDMDKLKELFNTQWKNYKLGESKIKLKKDNYWLMIINGINLNKHITNTELKIYYPEVVGYIDAVDSDNDELTDWKSSTRSEINEHEYTQQLKLYAWLYHRKFNKIPKKCTVEYLKYSGSKGTLSITPTDKDVIEIEDWFYDTLKKMEAVKEKDELPPKCEGSCNFFCPYKNLCESDNTESLRYDLHIKGNNIFIQGSITNLLSKGLDNKFSYELKNAHFIKKANPHARTTIRFWNPNTRILPLGFMKGLVKTLTDYAKYKKKEIVIDLHDERTFDDTKVEMPDKFVNGRTLRDYQTDAVDKFLRDKIGILEIGTGGGKTEIAIECIRRLGMKTLFVVDKIELLKQTKKRIEDALGIEVGQLGGGKQEIKDITVATVQTITKNLNTYSLYLRSIRFAIFDETHKVAARSYFRIAQQLTGTEYRLGISGTAYRDDGNDMMINASVGEKLYDLSSKVLIENGWLMKPTIVFIKNYMTKEQIKQKELEQKTGLINEQPKYAEYYNGFIVNNKQRNNMIIKLINENKEKKLLILVKLVEHGKMLEELIPNSRYLYGETNKKERDKIFNNFVSGKLTVLISTISIFSEGIDIPSLDMVINASANKGDVKSIQVLGRVLRKMDGKKEAHYYDFFDDVRFFNIASLKRKRAFYREGHKVEVVDINDS